jgi:hypothetical protein
MICLFLHLVGNARVFETVMEEKYPGYLQDVDFLY